LISVPTKQYRLSHINHKRLQIVRKKYAHNALENQNYYNIMPPELFS
jgi:hypothetical protein